MQIPILALSSLACLIVCLMTVCQVRSQELPEEVVYGQDDGEEIREEEDWQEASVGRNKRSQARILLKRQDGGSAPTPGIGDKRKLVCYYNNQGAMRTRKGLFTVDMIDANLCTHLIYLALGLDDKGAIKSYTPKVDFEAKKGQDMLRKFSALKNNNPALKTMLAIEGNSEKYSPLVASEEMRATFVKSVLDYMAKYNLDGLDLVWKYPNDPRGKEEDKANYVKLVEELKRAFEPKGYLLSAALPVGARRIEAGVDVKAMSDQLDFINLMSYDYNGGWDNETGVHAPLHESTIHDRSDADRELNVNWSIQHWLSLGADPKKLMLGITTYGRSFNLADPAQDGINSPVKGNAKPGPYTKNDRLLGYNEICETLTQEPSLWKLVRDPEYQVPYAVKGTQWVGYEDAESAKLKAKFALAKGLGGVTITSLCMDDFSGECKDSAGEPYPITKAVRREMVDSALRASSSGGSSSLVRSDLPLASTGENDDEDEGAYRLPPPGADGGDEGNDEIPTPPKRPKGRKPPKGDGGGGLGRRPPVCGTDDQWWFPGPSCQEYYDCTSGEAVLKQCKQGLVWRQSRLWCDYPHNVPECSG